MYSLDKERNMSTPKRRRLGNTKIVRASQVNAENIETDCSPISRRLSANEMLDRCDSPHLPCNQVEYLSDSGRNSSASDILCSPHDVIQMSGHQWESLNLSQDKIYEYCEIPSNIDILENENVLHSKENNQDENHFKSNIIESFDVINDSITNINEVRKDISSLFETKDSFLLDIKESGIVNIAQNDVNELKNIAKEQPRISNSFYGLPLITKGLFKTYRNIETFYDWQEECLNLDAIKEKRNLIYALPTSGGKTLVAEVLMMREVLNHKRNALFILPFVAIVQEKIWALSPFAVQLEFLVEEYAAGKGHIPPIKRRKKNSIYVATIEKGLALIRSLIELNRLHEIGLIVVDELHLIGEKGRGGTLEMLLSTVIFTNQNIQIVGMSATIGNLNEIAKFLKADVFQKQFRPVELTEYVKIGKMLHRIQWCGDEVEVIPDRELVYDYSAAAVSLDPDLLGGLVSEVVPGGSCLVFCPTKRNCENVAALLCKLQRREMLCHRGGERAGLERALRAEGAEGALARAVRAGVGWHHAGLAADERGLLEHAFRSGVISVLCCTSTLAAGVNLPAQRVIVRAPFVGREFISLGAYRQMVGRAGRAGVCNTGESVIICEAGSWGQLGAVLRGGLAPARSQLAAGALLLGGAALGLAAARPALRRLARATLRAHAPSEDGRSIESVCDEALSSLVKCNALEIVPAGPHDTSPSDGTISDDTTFVVSKLGRAAIKGCMDLSSAKQLLQDIEVASRGLVLMGSLHLLYLVTPHDAVHIIRLDYRHYYAIYSQLDSEGLQTAATLGITQVNALKMVTGTPITNVSEMVLCRFYLALMLRDLWRQVPFSEVAQKYCVARGTLQAVMGGACSFASSAARACPELLARGPRGPALWGALLNALSEGLRHCAAPELQQLMELPAVKKARAHQLYRAGFKRIEDLAKASAEDLVSSVSHLSRTAANQLISAARMMLIEKVENLRAEAEDVMEELNI